ncbi:MAG TPA: serine hydrolase domain-containing protein [Actinomycetota bacterium]
MGRDRVDALLPRIDPSLPGYVVRIAHGEGAAFRTETGAANASTEDPLRSDSPMYVGSLAKQFVAACVAILVHEGVIDLQDPIAAYVPSLPAWGGSVHLEHLIHHTGGLPHVYRPSGGIDPDGVPPWGNEDLLEEIRAIPDPLDEPGTRHVYTGDGYLLLSEVVARAAMTPLASFARERLFEPLAMHDTFFRDAETELPARAARGHFRATDGRLHVEPARFHAVGSGGLWTTADNLARWAANLLDDRLTGGWLAKTLTTPGRLADGRPIHYAWGVSVRTHRGQPIVSHGGSFPGWESKLVVFPEQRATFICLANSQELDVSSLTFNLADHILADSLDPNAPHADQTLHGG